MLDYCDFNNDGSLSTCEVFDCVVICENEWRAEYCPTYGEVYCINPYYCASCEGEWTCDDIVQITEDIMGYNDTNMDG